MRSICLRSSRTLLTGKSETIGTVLAAHAAAAILASREGEELQSALTTRDRIGQAKGIIMERYGVDDIRAFEMLRRALAGQQYAVGGYRAAGHRDARVRERVTLLREASRWRYR